MCFFKRRPLALYVTLAGCSAGKRIKMEPLRDLVAQSYRATREIIGNKFFTGTRWLLKPAMPPS